MYLFYLYVFLSEECRRICFIFQGNEVCVYPIVQAFLLKPNHVRHFFSSLCQIEHGGAKKKVKIKSLFFLRAFIY